MRRPRPWPTDGTQPGLKEQKVALVARDPEDPEQLVYASGVGDKRRLLAATTGPLWATWRGKWHDDLFDVPRRRAAEEVGEGRDVKREVATPDRLLIEWFQGQAHRAGLRTVDKSLKADNVTAAHSINAAGPRPEVKAIAWFALTDLRWTGRIRSVEQLWRSWDLIRGDWIRADRPEFEEE